MKTLLSIVFATLSLIINAQPLSISYYTEIVSHDKNLSDEHLALFRSRLDEIVMNHAAGATELTRFVLTGTIRMENSSVTEGLIPQWNVNGTFLFVISDVMEKRKLKQQVLPFSSRGESEMLAMKRAISTLDANSIKLKELFEDASKEIITYYESRCAIIILEADAKVAINNHDEAIYMLSSLPFISQECNTKLLRKAGDIYMAKQNYECGAKLNDAKSKWAASQDLQTASCIGEILGSICHEACCFPEAEAFAKTVSDDVKRLHEQDFKINYELTVVNEQKRIEAARQVGVAYGKNQVSPIYTTHK